MRIAGHRDQPCIHALEDGQDRQEFRRLAGIGDGEHDVAARDHAEIAMARLGRVQEKGGRAGARKGRRDLAADVAGLAHAGNDHAAGACEQHPAGLLEIGAQAFHERSDGAGLDPERFAPHLDQALAVGGVIHRFGGRVIRMQSGIIHRPPGRAL